MKTASFKRANEACVCTGKSTWFVDLDNERNCGQSWFPLAGAAPPIVSHYNEYGVGNQRMETHRSMAMLGNIADSIRRWLPDQTTIAERVVSVMTAVPHEVRTELFGDPGFHLAMEDFVPGRGTRVWMGGISTGKRGNRCVVLRHRLATCSADFAYFVIAHEIAHAILWNGGWNEITDPEDAADALAVSWGFVPPPGW